MIDESSTFLTLIGSHEMEVVQRIKGNTVILTMRGTTFSDSTVEWLRRVIRSHERTGMKRLILDFGDVRYLNSLGIAALLSARKAMERVDGKLLLAGINDHVKDILQRTSLLQHFQILPTLRLALEEIA